MAVGRQPPPRGESLCMRGSIICKNTRKNELWVNLYNKGLFRANNNFLRIALIFSQNFHQIHASRQVLGIPAVLIFSC